MSILNELVRKDSIFLSCVNKTGAKKSQRKMNVLYRQSFVFEGGWYKYHHLPYCKDRQMHHSHMDGCHLTDSQLCTLTTSLKLCPSCHLVASSNAPGS